MTLQSIFINHSSRLRSGWRLLVFIAIFVALQLLFGTGVWIGTGLLQSTFASIPYEAIIADLIGRLALLLAALLAGFFCNRFIENLPWRALGLTLHPGWLRDLIVGTGVGVASLLLAVGVATIAGGLHFTLNVQGMWTAVPKTLVSSAVLFVIAALAEEALFRGYVIQTLSRAQLAWFGVLLTSVPFGIVHLWNPNVVPGVTFANTALAGIWLALAYLRTRSLWFPLGIHWAWNWALASVCGLPVSGMKFASQSLLLAADVGPKWITGGSYGIEGGVAGTVALLVSLVFVWRTKLVSANPELLAMTSEENPVRPPGRLSIKPVEDNV